MMSTSDASTSRQEVSPLCAITIETLKESVKVGRTRDPMQRDFIRIPQKLFETNPDAYRPQYVSLGAFHYLGSCFNGPNDVNVLAMEGKKQEYMLYLLQTTENPSETLRICREYILNKLNAIHGCYYGKRDVCQELVARIVLVDACFLLGFFDHMPYEVELMHDTIIWSLRRDAAILENQLPFFVMQGLLEILIRHGGQKSMLGLSLELFIDRLICLFQLTPRYPNGSREEHLRYCSQIRNLEDCKHFLDIVTWYHLPNETPSSAYTVTQVTTTSHPVWDKSPRSIQLRSATQLNAAGVRFLRVDDPKLLVLKFANGVLDIPALVIHDSTEIVLLNLLAYEHLNTDSPRKENLASYVMLMMHLVETKKDLELLESKGIIVNELGSREDGSKIFHNLSKHILLRSFIYKDLCAKIEEFANSRFRKYMLYFKMTHLKNPWTVTSLIAASVLLIFTAAQTGYTIAAYYRQGVT